MRTDRRTFLFRTGSAAAVFGLPSLGCHATRRPQALKEALQRMRAENKPGIAIRLSADPATRHLPGHALLYHLNHEEADSRETFAESVFVCLDSAVLQDHLRGVDPAHSIVLFDTGGYAYAGVRHDFAKDWEHFMPRVRALIHGPGNARLQARAEAIRKAADPSAVEALDRLGGEADQETLLRHAPTIAPLLVHARLVAADKARQEALRDVIEKYYDSVGTLTAGPKLPYGVESRPGSSGCGDDCDEAGPRNYGVACGMGFAGPKTRSFVRYLVN